jgi:hypothetical protein
MNRARLTQLLCLGAAICIGSSAARAQGIRVFVEGSGSFFLDQKNFNIPEVVPKTGLSFLAPFRSNYASGGRITLGAEFTPWKIAGLEAAYGYGTNNLRVTSLASTVGPSGTSSGTTQGYGVKSQRLSTNLVVHSPVAFLRLRPYATAGLEYDHFGPTSQAKASATIGFAGEPNIQLGASNKIGINYGGGIEWSFLRKLALRVDVRDHITGTPTYGLTSGQYSVGGLGHDAELSAGFVIHLGK